MELFELVVVAGALVLAGLVHGTLGIGFPLVSTPLLATVLDVRHAVLITLLPTIAVNLVSIVHGGGWRARLAGYWPLAPWVLGAAVCGALLLTVFDPRPFKLVLAAMIIVYLNVQRIRFLRLTWVNTSPHLGMAVFGVLAGLSAGSVNVMVPILIIYALQRKLAKEQMVPVFNMCFACGKISQVAVFGTAGLLSGKLLLATAAGAALAVLALVIGIRLRARISVATYEAILRRLLLIMAPVLIGEFFWEL
ncbi:MAG: sulfite exporter TauE/SafE family protein [Gammaproteobacteria bacterium]|nr:sulfite exporter TauE/SafE family protein [Gammaproteobacteria bacterium]